MCHHKLGIEDAWELVKRRCWGCVGELVTTLDFQVAVNDQEFYVSHYTTLAENNHQTYRNVFFKIIVAVKTI